MEESGNVDQEVEKLEKLPKKRLRKLLIVEDEEKSDEESLEIPMTRIKLLANFGTDCVIRNNSLKIMAKATELFLQECIKKTAKITKSKRKKTVALTDLLEVISDNSNLAFIKDAGLLPNLQVDEET